MSDLDLSILVTHYWNFSKSKGHNSAENYSTWPKFKLNLCILVTHLYTEFQSKMSMCNGDYERKLKMNGIFLRPRGITLPKIIRPDPNSKSTCVFLWHIYIPNFNSKCQTYVLNFICKSPCMTEIMSGNRIRNEGKTEWRKGVSLYAPAILWREHKNMKLPFSTKHSHCGSIPRNACVSPAKQSYAWLPRKYDYRADRHRDRQMLDKVIPICGYALQATQESLGVYRNHQICLSVHMFTFCPGHNFWPTCLHALVRSG